MSRSVRLLAGALLALTTLLSLAAPVRAYSDGELLPVGEAFVLTAKVQQPGRIHLHWDIARHYYLYRGRIHVTVKDPAIRAGALQLPPGQDEVDPYLGKVSIYHDQVDAILPYTLVDSGARSIQFEVQFQGCHEVDPKICYPPHTQTLRVALPAAAGTTASTPLLKHMLPAGAASSNGSARAVASTPPVPANQASAEETLAQGLSGQHRWLALLGFFVAGLALSFTPCVLPMIPILSGLIVGAGQRLSTGRAFALSLTYVLASSVVFVVAGVVAGLIGASVQAAFQSPWLLGAFALLFVLLALSLFGFYELRLPGALQNRIAAASNRQRGGSLIGVAVMGILSGLIVGPCVAPPLAGAVLYIAQQHDPVFGGLALFVLSLGMGVPLLLFGVAAGRWLPHAGAWMKKVQAVFGVVFLALAIWMLSRFLDTLWIMLMSGVLMIACAVYLGAFDRTDAGTGGWTRLWKSLGWVLLLLGAFELIGAAAGSRNLLEPLAGLHGGRTASAVVAPDFRRIKTVAELDQALAAAKAAGQPVMLDFTAEWCVSCKEMEHFTYADPAVAAAMSRFVLLKADVTANQPDDRALLKHFGLFGPPATLFYAADGHELRRLRLVGFESAGAFRQRLDRAEQG